MISKFCAFRPNDEIPMIADISFVSSSLVSSGSESIGVAANTVLLAFAVGFGPLPNVPKPVKFINN